MAISGTARASFGSVRHSNGFLSAHLSTAAPSRVHLAIAGVQSDQRDHLRRAQMTQSIDTFEYHPQWDR